MRFKVVWPSVKNTLRVITISKAETVIITNNTPYLCLYQYRIVEALSLVSTLVSW